MSSSPLTIKGGTADAKKSELIHASTCHSDAHYALLGKVGASNTPGSGPCAIDANNNFPVPNDGGNPFTEKLGFSSARLGERARILDNSNRDGNVVYIVRAIIQVIRKGDDDKKDDPGYVLIQECKKTSYEKWNLPAGNVNRDEDIEEAMKRIVEQETGLRDAQPERIVMVEEVGPYWFRFTYHVTFDQRYQKNINSHLKQKRDEYSIKASVWKLKEIQDLFVNLRDESIITVLKEFRNQVKRREELNRNSIHKAPIRAPYQYEDQCINPLKLNVIRLPQEYITIRAVFLYRHDEMRVTQEHYGNSRTSVAHSNQNSRQSRIQHRIDTGNKIWTLCRKSKSGNRCPIIPCWPAMAKKCCQSEIYVFLTYVHDTDTIHRFSFIPLGITQIENSKPDGTSSGQGLRLTIVYRLNQTIGPQSTQSADAVSSGPPKLKPNVEYAWEQLEDEQAKGYLNDHTRSNGTLLAPLKSLRLTKIGHDREPQRRDEMSLDTWENTLHRYGIKK